MSTTGFLVLVLIFVIVVSLILRATVDRFLSRQLALLEREMAQARQQQEELQRTELRLMRAAEEKDGLERDIQAGERKREQREQAIAVLRQVPITFIRVYPRMANRTGEYWVLLGKAADGTDLARESGGEPQLLLVAGVSRADLDEVLRSYPPLRGFAITEAFEMKRFRKFVKARTDQRIASLDREGLVSLAELEAKPPALPAPQAGPA